MASVSTWSGIRNKLEQDYLARLSAGTSNILPPATEKVMTKSVGRPSVWTESRYCGATLRL